MTEKPDKGLIDFGRLFDPANTARYCAHPLPAADTWGVLLRQDHPLAEKPFLTAENVAGLPLIISRRFKDASAPEDWLGQRSGGLNIVATYSLLFNASLIVEDGQGAALCLDGILNTSGDGPLCFRPLHPAVRARMSVVWKKYQVFSRAVEAFLELLRQGDGMRKPAAPISCLLSMTRDRKKVFYISRTVE